MNLYAIEVTLHATACVKARTLSACLPDLFSAASFAGPALPLASIAPAMTIGAISSETLIDIVALDLPKAKSGKAA